MRFQGQAPGPLPYLTSDGYAALATLDGTSDTSAQLEVHAFSQLAVSGVPMSPTKLLYNGQYQLCPMAMSIRRNSGALLHHAYDPGSLHAGWPCQQARDPNASGY